MIAIVHSIYSQSVHAPALNAGLMDNDAERYCRSIATKVIQLIWAIDQQHTRICLVARAGLELVPFRSQSRRFPSTPHVSTNTNFNNKYNEYTNETIRRTLTLTLTMSLYIKYTYIMYIMYIS